MSLRHELALLRKTLTIVSEALNSLESADELSPTESNRAEQSDDSVKPSKATYVSTKDALSETPDSQKREEISSFHDPGDIQETGADESSAFANGRPEEGQRTTDADETPAAHSPALKPSPSSTTHNDDHSAPRDGSDSTAAQAKTRPTRDEDLGEDASEWLQNVPWDNPEDAIPSEGPSRMDSADDPVDDPDEPDGNSAADFLADLPWAGGNEQDEKVGEPKKKVQGSADKLRTDTEQDAESFFEEMDWSGNETEKAAKQDDVAQARVTVDPKESSKLPEHVDRILKKRQGEKFPDPSGDALERSGKPQNKPGEKKE